VHGGWRSRCPSRRWCLCAASALWLAPTRIDDEEEFAGAAPGVSKFMGDVAGKVDRVAGAKNYALSFGLELDRPANDRGVREHAVSLRGECPAFASRRDDVPDNLDAVGEECGGEEVALDRALLVDQAPSLGAAPGRRSARRLTRMRGAGSPSRSSDTATSNPSAICAATRNVGLLRPRSTSESMAALTPLRSASCCRLSPSVRRRERTASSNDTAIGNEGERLKWMRGGSAVGEGADVAFQAHALAAYSRITYTIANAP
jgi:hypothetical protein